MLPHFLVAIADLTHPLLNKRSSIRIIGCFMILVHTNSQKRLIVSYELLAAMTRLFFFGFSQVREEIRQM